MADAAHVDTDKKIKKLEKNIKEIYNEAQADIEDKINDFVKKYHAKESIYAQQVKEGKITQEQFDNWKKGQVFQGQQWQAKRDQIISTIHDSNTIATKIINGAAFGVFKNNANYTAYDLEHSNGVNFGFGIYDTSTVSKLLKDNPDLLPKWKVNEQKDYVWNKKKVNNAITQGIIQGERLDQITKRISTGLAAQNENTMKTFARTAMTGAQNAGREQRLQTLKTKGINVVKQWMATLDGRTRDSHRHMDGETLPVAKDIWHPVTFSNGCRYPGDPQGPAQEVYNCRCTMVGDVPDFPDEYKRYDNIDGKPIKNMTYQEWYKAKYGKELKAKKLVEKSASKFTGIDYAKYGGKEAFDIMAKYDGDIDKIINEAPVDEFDVLWNKFDSITGIEEMANKAKADIELSKKLAKETKVGKAVKSKKKELTEVEKLQAQVDAAKADLKAFEDTLDKDIFNKKWSGIWQEDVTLFDYEAKKDKILEKRLYYLKSNVDLEKQFAEEVLYVNAVDGSGLFKKFMEYESFDDFKKDKSMINRIVDLRMKDGSPVFYYDDEDDLKDFWDLITNSRKYKQAVVFTRRLKELEEFEDLGRQYASILKELEEKRLQVKSAEGALKLVVKGNPFDESNYTKAKKNAALWGKSKKETDGILRPETSRVWQEASQDERYAAWDYTAGSGKFNRPLRGYDNSWGNFKGVGNVPLDNEGAAKEIEALTRLIDNSTLQQDTWLQRGVDFDGASGFFGLDEMVLSHATEEELQQLLVGKEVKDAAFMSCGSTKGQGFTGDVLINIYCPEGTKAIYAEPFSRYGKGGEKNWDGISTQEYFGSEFETIIQRNSTFRISKISRDNTYGRIFVDVEVVGQDPWGVKY